jgi:DNA-binding CsgD family transcriptional regulator
MDLLTYLLQRLGWHRAPQMTKYALDEALHSALNSLAEQQQRSPDELASSLVASGLAQQSARGELWSRWLALSAREQQITALTCLGYTNPQMAARLGLSVETVRSHTRNVQVKFNVKSKASLRVLLSEWDFSAFGD